MKPVILIVDDQESARDTLKGVLFNQGYELAFAENGMEALKKTLEIKPDLILLDVMMPEMDGFEVCRRMRKEPALAEIPIIILTVLDDEEAYIEGIEAGADDFIPKPFNRSRLRARLKTITKLNRYRKLHQEMEKFEWVVEKAEDGYLMLNDKEEITYINQKAKEYLGFYEDKDTVRSKTFIELAKRYYHFEPQANWYLWPEIMSHTKRYLVRPETEHSFAFWLQVDLMDMSGGIDGYLIRLHNITEKIEQRENVWKFHNLISHKFRTPLVSLGIIFDFLKMDRNKLSEQEAEQFIEEAYDATMKLKERIMDITNCIHANDLLRPSLGKCSIHEINTMLEEIKIETEIKSLCISSEESENLLISFSTNAMRMVIRELLINAKKFHPKQSPSVEVNISHIPEGIKLKVSDNGLSLTPDQLSNMWVFYHQSEKHFTGELPGMGLGLSTIASMVWSAGGTCKSYNRHGGPGIVIEIILPECNAK